MVSVSDTEELLKSRREIYGDIRHNANCQAELKEVLRKYATLQDVAFGGQYDWIAHMECLEYVLEKMARIVTAPEIHEDNYNDIKGYAELARKIAMGESTAP